MGRVEAGNPGHSPWDIVTRVARWGGVGTIAACAIAIRWIDLPLTRWLHRLGTDQIPLLPLTLEIPVGLSTAMGLYLVGHVLFFNRLTDRTGMRRAFHLAIGMMVALAAKTMLKIAFGRTWPRLVADPTPGQGLAKAVCRETSCGYLNDGIHAFVPFAGSTKAFAAFPSGSTALLVAFVLPLMAWFPRSRIPLGLVSVLALTSYVVTDIHFLSDVIAGAYVGTVCAMATVAAERTRQL